jgi:glycerol-3-phosphate acyltransferase PlsY
VNPSDLLPYAVAGVAAYLLGAVPFGLVVARIKGVDIRKVGSGNIGATNVFRSVGKGLGILTFALDAAKGYVPAGLFPLAAERAGMDVDQATMGVVCGLLAVAGHNWPVYLGFKGGKGIATSAGALLGFAPLATLVGLGTWVVVFGLTRYVSVGSIAACVTVAGSSWWLCRGAGTLIPVVLTLLGAVGVWRHRTNVRRLLDGTEHRFGRKKEAADGQGGGEEP